MSVIISAVFKAKSGKEKDLENALVAIIPKVEAETGAWQYAIHRAAAEPGKFFIYEKYANQDAVNHHMSTPYLKELLNALGGLLEGEPVIETYQELAAIRR